MSLTEDSLQVLVTQERIKLMGQEGFRLIFRRMEFSWFGKDRTGFRKNGPWRFLEKITAYPNEAIHDDCVVAFTGGYEK